MIDKKLLRAVFFILVILSFFICSIGSSWDEAVPIGTTVAQFSTLEPIRPTFESPIGTLVPMSTAIAPIGSISIGSEQYPIGEIFHDASGLRLAGERSDIYGRFGLATIQDQPEYRLIWYRESIAETNYLIIKMDDDLYSGENGYVQHFEAFLSNLDKMLASGAAGVAGAATLVGLGIGGCAPSLGAGCIVAGVGGALSLLGGLIGEAYYYYFHVKPEMEALESLFETIDANR